MKEISDAILGKDIVSQKSSTDVEGTKRGREKRKRIPSRKVRTPSPALSSDSGGHQLSKHRERKQRAKAQSSDSNSSLSEIEVEDASNRKQRSRGMQMSSKTSGANTIYSHLICVTLFFFLDVLLLGSSTFSTSNVPTHSEQMVTLPRVPSSLGRQSLLTNEKEFEPVAGPSGYRGDRLYLTQHKLT
jgi:hypothetical protein